MDLCKLHIKRKGTKVTDTYCSLPWISVNSWGGDITPCCFWEGNGVVANNTSEALNSQFFENIRKDMLENKKIEGCKQCYQTEECGKTSRRQRSIEKYGYPTEIKLKSMDVGFDNVCNLKCRSCQSGASHLWHKDEIKMYGETIHPTKYWSYITTANVDDLEYVHVAGGEPLLSTHFNKFAKELIESTNKNNLELSFDTNGTIFPKDNILELIKQVGSLRVGVSIDGLYGLQDYFRSGSNFNSIIEHLNFYKKLKQDRVGPTKLDFQITVNIYNVNTLPEMYKYFKEHHPEFNINHRVLFWPEQLSIKNLPMDYKQDLISLFDNKELYSDVLHELQNTEKDLFDHFLNFHDKLDSIRKETLGDLNPMLSNYIKNYKRNSINSQIFFIQQLDYLR
jgi:MoaA/NifB/PqqE/SkfB family radical SAM enzyme